ncbi:hypothetical protein G9C85_09765 [Halorubellus sp. JP-L1]|uniref:arylsulfotransferase family protein n=1 Tax=Halorubellus sp. JP-L1 TaxID=2715753 RepID=UPI00140E3B4D|nr:arylsulfotransferase family protein [Halorubellus sp. JP-L1]NHN41913.1 hypothetical protein [Halorubellus sp. JP-L1]
MLSLSSIADAPRRHRLRAALAVVVLLLVVGAGVATANYTPPELEAGTVESEANGTTYVAVQGFHFDGQGNGKKPARLVATDERAQAKWVYDGGGDVSWFYDVDPLPNGNLLAVNTKPGKTLVYELNPETRERVWTETLNITDTHDVDLINDDQLLVANLRNSEGSTSDEGIFIYNLTTDERTWEWKFENHYPDDTDQGISNTEDWSHVNDVDKIGDGEYLVSPRNFDEVIVVNKSTKNVTMRLGSDGNHDILDEQHNPTYLESENGTPTMLVADSENDRVVEYACESRYENGTCDWNLVWEVGDGQFDWPRDADRLPNGNTLVVDTQNHRVVEVTPEGEIVWEALAPWAPYDVERAAYGDEAMGTDRPTIRDMNESGSYQLSGSAGLVPGTGDSMSFSNWVTTTLGDLPVVGGPANAFADQWDVISEWVRPVWLAPWGFVGLVLAGVLVLAWLIGEVAYWQRARIGRVQARLTG